MRPWTRWPRPRICTVRFRVPTPGAWSIAARKPMPCSALLRTKMRDSGRHPDVRLDLARSRERASEAPLRSRTAIVPAAREVRDHRPSHDRAGSPQEVELYEYDPLYWRVRRVAISDAGNLATWIVPRREMDQALATVEPEAERIRRLAPEAIRMGVAAATREVTLRFRGLEFARWRNGDDVVWPGRPHGIAHAGTMAGA